MDSVLARKYTTLNQQSVDLLRAILEQVETVAGDRMSMAQFTQKDCERWTGLSNTTVRRRLSPLIWAGILEVEDTSKPVFVALQRCIGMPPICLLRHYKPISQVLCRNVDRRRQFSLDWLNT